MVVVLMAAFILWIFTAAIMTASGIPFLSVNK